MNIVVVTVTVTHTVCVCHMVCLKWAPFAWMYAGSLLHHRSIAVSLTFWSRLHQTWTSQFLFINTPGVCMVKQFLNGCPYLIVNWLEACAVWMSKLHWNKVWLLSNQQFDSFSSTMCRCTVLLKHVSTELIWCHFTKSRWIGIRISKNQSASWWRFLIMRK